MRRLSMILTVLCVLLLGVMPGFAADDDADSPAAGQGSGTAAIEKKDPMKEFETWSGKITLWITESTAKLAENKLNAKQAEKLITEIAKKLENLQKRQAKMNTQMQNIQKQLPIVTDLQSKVADLQGKAKAYKPVEKMTPTKDPAKVQTTEPVKKP